MIKIGDGVTVGKDRELGIVKDIEVYDGTLDYLVTPLDIEASFACKCGQPDCMGSQWVRVEDIDVFSKIN